MILSKGGPPISYLFFADDLLLFGEAIGSQMEVIRECLNRFCEPSGLRVSIEKTRFLLSRNVNHNVAGNLAAVSGFNITHDLGKYLGVSLIHKRTDKETYRHILDQTQQRLTTWRAESLSFAGRVTLAQSVVAALPMYTMQTTLFPRYVCYSLERMMRDFIWGSRENGRRCHMVAWHHFCMPRKDGGLGFRDLHGLNKALMMKLS